MQANMHQAKSQLSQLVDLALTGEDVIIAKSGKPIARLIPYTPKPARVFGQFKDEIQISDDFDSDETNNEIAELFSGDE